MRLAILMLGLVACGGNFTGVDRDKAFADLSDDEICQISDETEDYARERLDEDALCILTGQFTAAFALEFEPGADFEALCEAAVAECQSTEPEPVEPVECDASEYRVDATCTATVGDHEACVKAQLKLYRDVISIGCDAAFLDDPLFTDDEEPALSECEVFEREECAAAAALSGCQVAPAGVVGGLLTPLAALLVRRRRRG